MVSRSNEQDGELIVSRGIGGNLRHGHRRAAVRSRTRTAFQDLPLIHSGENGRLIFRDRRSVKASAVVIDTFDRDGSGRTGRLEGFPWSLRVAWLAPVVTLKLSHGRYHLISITEVDGRNAKFEILRDQDF